MNPFSVQLLEEAEGDALEAVFYYDMQRNGLGDEFLDDLRLTQEALSTLWATEIKYEQVRKRSLSRFPYVVYYRVDEAAEYILIDAILHERALPR